MGNSSTNARLSLQDPTDPACESPDKVAPPEFLQSIEEIADYQEAIASIAQGMSEAKDGRGTEAARFFHNMKASRG